MTYEITIMAGNHTINLDDLTNETRGITPAYGASLAEAAVVCLNEQNHQSGVHLKVDGDYNNKFPLIWSHQVSSLMIRTWSDRDYATEQGAYGIAILLIINLTDLAVTARSWRGTGFDFWLGPIGNNDLLFQKKSRLEVSGIRRGDESNINARVKKKIKQTDRSNNSLPAYVVVVEFSRPLSRVKRR